MLNASSIGSRIALNQLIFQTREKTDTVQVQANQDLHAE